MTLVLHMFHTYAKLSKSLQMDLPSLVQDGYQIQVKVEAKIWSSNVYPIHYQGEDRRVL